MVKRLDCCPTFWCITKNAMKSKAYIFFKYPILSKRKALSRWTLKGKKKKYPLLKKERIREKKRQKKLWMFCSQTTGISPETSPVKLLRYPHPHYLYKLGKHKSHIGMRDLLSYSLTLRSFLAVPPPAGFSLASLQAEGLSCWTGTGWGDWGTDRSYLIFLEIPSSSPQMLKC